MPPPARPVTEQAVERIQVALLHFEITLRTHSAGLPVDWSYTCYQMARALAGDADDAGDVDALGEPLELELATRRVLRQARERPMNEAGLVFWVLIAASLCCVLLAIGLLGAIVRAHRPEDWD